MRIVKFTVIGLIGLIVVLAVGLVIAINTVDLARYQGLVADRVEAATGRALAIDGALDIGISLSPTLVAEGVRFANPPGSENPDMVRIARIEAQVQLWPLLRGRVALDRLIIIDPEIRLEIDANGQGNWLMTSPDGDGDAQADGVEDDDDGNSPLAILAGLGTIRIEGGQVTYTAAGAEPIRVSLDRIVVENAGPGAPITINAELEWDGEIIHAALTTASLATLADSLDDLPADFTATGFGAEVQAKGRVTGNQADLAINLTVDNLSAIKDHFGVGIATNVALLVRGQLSANPTGIAFSGTQINLGTSDLAGNFAVRLDGPRPLITAELLSNRFDLAHVVVPATEDGAAPAAEADEQPEGARLIPDTPMSFAPLEAVDADVSLTVGELLVPGLALKNTTVSIDLQEGGLDVTIHTMTLTGGGVVQGALTVDGPSAAMTVNLTATQVALEGLAKGALANAVQGAVDVDVTLAGHGQSPAAMAASLDGEISVVMGEGRAKAQVLDTFVGGVSTVIGTLFSEQSEWTVVNCAAVSFALVDRIATSQVLLFDSDAATVAGRGTLDLSTEALDFVVTPQAKVATLNVSTPVLVGGTLADPSFAPDPLALARKVGGLLGIFVFPPAALLGLGELGHSENSCVQLAADPPPPRS